VSARHEQLLDELRETLEELPRAIAAVEAEHLADSRPGSGEWSPREVMAHLADAETVYGIRIRMIVGGDGPRLEAYDQDRWTARFSDLDTLGSALERWRVMRESTLRLLDSLSEDEWSRSGLHAERGEESVLNQVEIMAGHDRGHLEQMLVLVGE